MRRPVAGAADEQHHLAGGSGGGRGLRGVAGGSAPGLCRVWYGGETACTPHPRPFFDIASSIARREGDSGSGLCVRPVRVGVGGCGRGEGVATEDVQRKAGTGGLLSAVFIHEGGCADAKE